MIGVRDDRITTSDQWRPQRRSAPCRTARWLPRERAGSAGSSTPCSSWRGSGWLTCSSPSSGGRHPAAFGCGPDFAFTSGTPTQLQRTRGLCDWIGIESVYATQPRPFFVANIDNRGTPEIAIDLGFLARLNGVFIDNVVKPNISWFGYVIFFSEAFIFASLLLGLLSATGRPGGDRHIRTADDRPGSAS